MIEVSEDVERINSWFINASDGEWEHHNVIKIESSDNPGWIFSVSLPESKMMIINNFDFKDIDRNIESDIVDGSLRIFSTELALVLRAASAILKEL